MHPSDAAWIANYIRQHGCMKADAVAALMAYKLLVDRLHPTVSGNADG